MYNMQDIALFRRRLCPAQVVLDAEMPTLEVTTPFHQWPWKDGFVRTWCIEVSSTHLQSQRVTTKHLEGHELFHMYNASNYRCVILVALLLEKRLLAHSGNVLW